MRTAGPSGSATVLLSFAVAVAACAPTTAETGPAVDAADCNKGVLDTLYPGILTFGADQPVYPPWYKGDDPANGEGFESALAYAVAATLQYSADDVRWVRVPFNAALTPGPKSFDVNLSQFSITDQRRAAVDFSSPYFDVTQAVVTTQGSPAAGVTTLEDLRSHRLGTQVDTTGHPVATTLLDDGAVQTYQTIVDAKMALLDGEIDAMVLDLPTALAMAGELRDGVLLGQLPSTGDEVEQFGIVLAYESPLTRCVSWAVDSLRADGALVRLQNRWLTDTGSVAVLR
ncbi:ABC transporter substrate-binding protein [Mycolicibacterium gilvum]|uniref:Extracellular solute-binding protein n=1 Tax=Mycolicibacterium gilvum TaxID=1804 RepID=A0A378SSI6_9MYCO|nr:ABC transporter substrate-binding protein [Mycolicibacterium gilvum]MCV7057270.1 amino acid ABC transporter substrate-binding protein [Mycolicibacterium gilvum]STZ45581.1 extracellular solute-binding protein [Mycolicibacterium gilvum]